MPLHLDSAGNAGIVRWDAILASLQTEILMVGHYFADYTWRDNGTPVVSTFARIYFVVKGMAKVEQGGKVLVLRPSRLFLIPGFSPFRYACPQAMEQYYLHIVLKIFGGVDAPAYLGLPAEINVNNRTGMLPHWRKMLNLWRQHTPAALLRADGLAREILALFLPHRTDNPARPSARRHRAMQQLAPALHYMETHLGERLTLATLARQVALQPNYFSNLFTATFGLPPRRYLMALRIQRAQAMLLKGEEKLHTIAAATGFYDEFHFSRCFKRHAGMPPSVFAAGSIRP